jgi:hypothetical protein
VTRREYAELIVRLGSVELQAHRNRVTLDLQGQRIAQMQEELNLLHTSTGRRTTDMTGIAIPPPPATVES